MAKMKCEYLRASGRSLEDCVVMGRRTAKNRGKQTLEDDWVLINEPGDDGATNTRAFGPWKDGLTGVWRSPSQRTFVAGRGAIFTDDGDQNWKPFELRRISRDLPIDYVKGIWGIDDECVFAWGSRTNMYGETSRVFQFDGKKWSLHSDLDRPITALSGLGPEHLCAAGEQGLSTWDGESWTHANLPKSSKLLDIHVSSRDEAYAVGRNGLFLELSGGAWKTAAKSRLEKRPLVAVAKYRGVLYVGAGAAGLLRREADGSLEVFDEDTYAVHLEARDALVVTEPHCITGTSDNEDFEATAEDMLAELTSSQPLG